MWPGTHRYAAAMIRSAMLVPVLSMLVLMLGACATDVAGESTEPSSAPAPPRSMSDAASSPAVPETSGSSQTPTSLGTGTTVTVATGDTEQYATVLTDGGGMTLYVFFEDTEGQSMCYDACADNWPPLLADGDPVAGGDADQALVGTMQRDDGPVQVTYNGHPLYLHGGDGEPGDVRGFGNGNVWYPVAPDGTPIEVAGSGGDAGSEY